MLPFLLRFTNRAEKGLWLMEKTAIKKKRMSKLEARKAKWGYVFLIPWLVMFCIFYAYPLVYGIAVSFTDFTLGSMKFTGWNNYKRILSDYAFWRSLTAMLAYAVIVIPCQVFLPMWMASILRPHGGKFNTAVKLLTYLPGVTCSVALVLSWKFMLDPNMGMLATILRWFGVTGFSLFNSAKTAIPALSILIVLSNLGNNLIIYSAALNSIPNDYYEAAELDGATRSQQFTRITMPLLHPTIVYVFITATIAALQIFVIPQLMTAGGPNYTTSTLLMMIYNTAFSNNQFGYASAIGVILFILTAIIAVIQFRVTKRDTVEY